MHDESWFIAEHDGAWWAWSDYATDQEPREYSTREEAVSDWRYTWSRILASLGCEACRHGSGLDVCFGCEACRQRPGRVLLPRLHPLPVGASRG